MSAEARRRAFRVRLAVLGLNASEAAALVEITAGYFTNIMNSKQVCAEKVAERIAEVLQIDRKQLFI